MNSSILSDFIDFEKRTPLCLVASELSEQCQLRCRLDAFSDHPKPEGVRQLDDRSDDGQRGVVRGDVGDEGLINLDKRDRELAQIHQRGVAGPDRHAHPNPFTSPNDRATWTTQGSPSVSRTCRSARTVLCSIMPWPPATAKISPSLGPPAHEIKELELHRRIITDRA